MSHPYRSCYASVHAPSPHLVTEPSCGPSSFSAACFQQEECTNGAAQVAAGRYGVGHARSASPAAQWVVCEARHLEHGSGWSVRPHTRSSLLCGRDVDPEPGPLLHPMQVHLDLTWEDAHRGEHRAAGLRNAPRLATWGRELHVSCGAGDRVCVVDPNVVERIVELREWESNMFSRHAAAFSLAPDAAWKQKSWSAHCELESDDDSSCACDSGRGLEPHSRT